MARSIQINWVNLLYPKTSSIRTRLAWASTTFSGKMPSFTVICGTVGTVGTVGPHDWLYDVIYDDPNDGFYDDANDDENDGKGKHLGKGESKGKGKGKG